MSFNSSLSSCSSRPNEKGTPDTRHLQHPYLEVILSHLAPAGLPVPHSRCSAKSGGPLVSLDFGLSVVFFALPALQQH